MCWLVSAGSMNLWDRNCTIWRQCQTKIGKRWGNNGNDSEGVAVARGDKIQWELLAEFPLASWIISRL